MSRVTYVLELKNLIKNTHAQIKFNELEIIELWIFS